MLKRGDVILADLEPIKGSEQGRIRPCLIVQNNVSNRFSPNTIVVPITTKIPDKEYPTIVIVEPRSTSGLLEKSTILCSQIRTISVHDRMLKRLGFVDFETMQKVDFALKASLQLS